VDRATAIEQAILEADAGDHVVIAGKGHENYQIIGSKRRPFDDRTVASAALALRRDRDGGNG
jgi:UDP-N-acetylmuramoyl-L-alanyl-D-glutamate--2,6-diaminopimelate ligase